MQAIWYVTPKGILTHRLRSTGLDAFVQAGQILDSYSPECPYLDFSEHPHCWEDVLHLSEF